MKASRRRRLTARQDIDEIRRLSKCEQKRVARIMAALPTSTVATKVLTTQGRWAGQMAVLYARGPVRHHDDVETSLKKNGRFLARYKGHTAYGKTPRDAIEKVKARAAD